jgi:Integrase core domain
MEINMNDYQLQSPAEIKQFLAGTQSVTLSLPKSERYAWIAGLLKRTDYFHLRKKDKTIIRTYLKKVSGYSNSQLTDLIKQYQTKKWMGQRVSSRTSFARRYTQKDIALLLETDRYHDTLSGPITKKLLERSHLIFGDQRYQRLAQISVSHLYNLRRSDFYRRQRHHLEKTKRTPVSIGERRKPQPNGQPGYIRIDTVHQGDYDKQKGVYHINAVDEVTQFEVICSVEKISEQYLIPVLEELLSTFPFIIKGFHSDNGSEYVNRVVSELLNKLHVEFTKSRSRHSNDNALVEGKNGSIIRKVLGYIHIAQKHAELMNQFNKTYWVPYLNYHRPCYFPKTIMNEKGKIKKKYVYQDIMTPYEKLKSLPNAQQYLKPQITFKQLDQEATAINDLQAAQRLQVEKDKLFKKIFATS